MSVSFTGLTPDNYPVNSRILQDINKSNTVALPATATTTNTGAIDLQNATPFPTTETIDVYMSSTASANGNSVNGTVSIQQTSANSDGTANAAAWANIPGRAGCMTIVEGASSTAAVTYRDKLPPGCLRFIRARITLATNTADLSDANFTIQLLF